MNSPKDNKHGGGRAVSQEGHHQEEEEASKEIRAEPAASFVGSTAK